MRNSRNFNIEWLYKYFTENGGKKYDLNLFFQSVEMYGIDKILTGLDVKFQITTLFNKDKQAIKFY